MSTPSKPAGKNSSVGCGGLFVVALVCSGVLSAATNTSQYSVAWFFLIFVALVLLKAMGESKQRGTGVRPPVTTAQPSQPAQRALGGRVVDDDATAWTSEDLHGAAPWVPSVPAPRPAPVAPRPVQSAVAPAPQPSAPRSAVSARSFSAASRTAAPGAGRPAHPPAPGRPAGAAARRPERGEEPDTYRPSALMTPIMGSALFSQPSATQNSMFKRGLDERTPQARA